jgi:hypothetical protein
LTKLNGIHGANWWRALVCSKPNLWNDLPADAGVRFDGACPPSPAADPQTTAIKCWHITAMFMSGRLPSAVAIRTIPTRGNGTAAFIRDLLVQ